MKLSTFRYAVINISYFACFCCIHAYAAVFLLDAGFSNTLIGINLALANILSVVLQPIVAGLIDKKGRLTNRNAALFCTLSMIIGSLLLLFVKGNIAFVFVIYLIIYMIQMLYQPLLIALNFEYAKAGVKIYFGLARGLGSAGFAVTSAFIGGIVEARGVNVLMIASVIALAVSAVFLYFFKKPVGSLEGPAEDPSDTSLSSLGPNNNIFDFIKVYPKFTVFVLGAVLLFFGHNAINDFFIQIITPLGGNETTMGYAIFLAALLELPTMAAIGLLMKKISCGMLLRIAGVFFLLKIIIITVASSMTGVYISEALQMCAYAVFIPASAYYVDEVMKPSDAVKGQAFVNCSITLGGVFSNLICGSVLDRKTPVAMLTIGAVVTLIGAVVVAFSVEKNLDKEPSGL